MGYLAKENTTLAIMQEVTEGTYVAPASGADYVAVLSDGLELSGAKELQSRNILNSSIGISTPRVGKRSASGSVGVEWKASGVAGDKPEIDPFLLAALGNVRQNTIQVTTKIAGNTDKILQIEDADISKFAVGDIVLVLEAGGYFTAPVTVVDTTGGAAAITLLFANPGGVFSNSVVIEKFTTYYPANKGHTTLSITKFLEGVVLEKAIGMRCTGLSLNNFSTGGLADLAFSLEGISYSQSVTAQTFTPIFDSGLPPLILEACVYQDGVEIVLNDLSLSIENAIGWIESTCSSDGRLASRITKRTVSGTINPYKSDASVANFTNFNTNTPFSLFFRAYNPTSVVGEYEEIVSVYLPNCIGTELATTDKDGILTDAISFSADRGTDGSTEEIYMSFI